jgi:hypothetical protein
MSMETYGALIDGLRAVPTLRAMAFWGFGEPLLHPQIAPMVDMAHGLGARTEMFSNGLLLDGAMAEALVSAGLDSLVLSVDGASAEGYADIRTGGALGRVLENVDRLREIRAAAGRAHARDRHRVRGHAPHLGELRHLPRLAQRMGATRIVVTNVLPYTEELRDETLYGRWAGRSLQTHSSEWSPEIVLPRVDLHGETLAAFAGLLYDTGYAQTAALRPDEAGGHCRFVSEGHWPSRGMAR